MIKKVYNELREDYTLGALELESVAPNPIDQFVVWFDEAIAARTLEPNAMTLATASKVGKPSARIVLLKDITPDGFVFYTNYESKKSEDIAQNPYAALVFNWLDLERQIRIEGSVQKVSTEVAELYFKSRPKSSQIGAWASPQSTVIDDRTIFEAKVRQLHDFYEKDTELPVPPFWGGYIVIPTRIEFWQGRSSRLHDRICYQLNEGGNWETFRLAP